MTMVDISGGERLYASLIGPEFDRACRAFFDYARRADTEAAMRAKGLK